MGDLLDWFKANGGYIHPATHLNRDTEKGNFLETKDGLKADTLIVNVPHSMALSCLNAMVDDSLPVLKASADSFTVEALGVFYLMAQWINKDKSFWRPYLEILNTPDMGFHTPFWFDEDDLKWLKGTDLFTSFQGRHDAWHTYWRDGTAILDAGGMDVSQYTW